MYTLVTPPSGDVVTLEEAKIHLRVDGSEEDDYISSLIAASVGMTEEVLRRKLLTQTWEVSLTSFSDVIALPWPPVQSVVSIKYTDSNGDEKTLDSSEYYAFFSQFHAEIEPRLTWPEVSRDVPYPVRIRFVCGYGTAQEVPAQIKLAIKMLVGTWYANRETLSAGGEKEIPHSYQWLLWPFRHL